MNSAQPAEKAAHKTQRTFIKQAGIATTSHQPQAAHQAILNDTPLPSIDPAHPFLPKSLSSRTDSLISQCDAKWKSCVSVMIVQVTAPAYKFL